MNDTVATQRLGTARHAPTSVKRVHMIGILIVGLIKASGHMLRIDRPDI